MNMFCEYTMVTEEKYSEYFGFVDCEVDELYERYLKQDIPERKVTREGLRIWYDGYHTKAGERVYNPRSVVLALENNNLGNYWTSSGPYDELFYYIGANVDSVKDDVGLLLSDIPVPARVQEYAATSMELKTRNEIFSAMVVYGFLNYENGCVSIPNKELMDKFAEMAQKVNHTVDEAIRQIKDRQYALRFEGRLGEKPEYIGRILAVGIAYQKNDKHKRHECKVEVLRDRL